MEDFDGIETVNEFWTHRFLQSFHRGIFAGFVIFSDKLVLGFLMTRETKGLIVIHFVGTKVGGQNNDSIVELHTVALTIGENSVLKNL